MLYATIGQQFVRIALKFLSTLNGQQFVLIQVKTFLFTNKYELLTNCLFKVNKHELLTINF